MRSQGAGLLVLGLLLGALASRLASAWMMPLLWLAACFVAVGVAYARGARGVFGKRPDGALAASRVLLLLPFLGLLWGVWHVARKLSREAPVDELSPRLRLARRLLPDELPADVVLVVDLTAEFHSSVSRCNYRSLPILDGGVPDRAQLRRVIDVIPGDGVTLIHCAQGHGRTALFAACLLIDRDGLTAEAATAAVLAARPLARMNRAQRAFVERFAADRARPVTPAIMRNGGGTGGDAGERPASGPG